MKALLYINIIFALLCSSCEQKNEKAINEEAIIAKYVTNLVVEALALDSYTEHEARVLLKTHNASFNNFKKRESNSYGRNITNDRDMFSFSAQISDNGNILGECWERSGPDQIKTIERLFPDSKLSRALTPDLEKNYKNASHMRNCDFLLHLTDNIDRIKLDSEFAKIIQKNLDRKIVRRLMHGVDMGGEIEKPIIDKNGIIIHLSYRTGRNSSAAISGIKVFSK